MGSTEVINYQINDPLELNLSYIPFIHDGGLFIPTDEAYSLGDRVVVDLKLPTKKDPIRIEGQVIWITPKNALHHVLPGIGIQFTGKNAGAIRNQIQDNIDPKMELGGYAYGITEEAKKDK